MKLLTAIAMMVMLVSTSASAQVTITSSPPPSTAFAADPIMRVTSTFRTALAGTDAEAVPDATAQETARRTLYRMAESECLALSEIFKGECRLSSVSTLVPIEAANARPSNSMSAMAIYELKPAGARRAN
jgi:hypothetical protein